VSHRFAVVLGVLALAACSGDASPAGFEGVSIANPRDLPVVGGQVDGREGPNGGTILQPRSLPIDEAVAHSFGLGHCGLFSPIDVDGSFWDALDGTTANGGALDLEANSEMINATSGVIVVIGDELRFRTDSGSVVRFERHAGEKEFPGCD
jgi:hypothetical protein